jgi:hypothetical protein
MPRNERSLLWPESCPCCFTSCGLWRELGESPKIERIDFRAVPFRTDCRTTALVQLAGHLSRGNQLRVSFSQ